MTTRDTAWPPGTPCWADLGVKDIPKARAFYSSLFGWTIPEGPAEAGGYSVAELGGRPVAGIGASQGDMPVFWATYLASENADETAAKVKAAGGQIIMEPFDVMDVGRMFIATDPGGAVFSVWQAGAHTGAQLVNEPGSMCWNENMSRNYEGNRAFYGSVFGYSYGDIDAGGIRYATLDLDGRPAGGIGEIGSDLPAEMPAAWNVYFQVPDTDAAVAKAVELGGRLVAPPWDTPYGRMAVVSDDQGAVFSVMSATGDQQA
jgi:predicted enzyme related to lactoylglutathione lyase